MRTLLRVPQVAWFTLVVFFGCLGLWSASIWAVVTDRVAMGWGTAGGVVSVYLMFTPLHEAVHQSIARRRWVNELVGRVCGVLMLAGFAPFRHVHLEHHKHTNDPEKDPDYWSGSDPKWALPLRWLTQDLHYWVVYSRVWAGRPARERYEMIVTTVGEIGVSVALIATGWGWHWLLLWIVPSKLAIVFLAYSFDYLPHVPHRITGKENRYRATLVRPNGLLTPLLLSQNLHLIHHLYPAVPFYRYGAIWRAQRETLLEKGVEVRGITGRVLSGRGDPP